MTFPALTLLLPLSLYAADVASSTVRSRADVHFLSGFDYFRAGKADDARKEWAACRELDEKHDFCEFGLSVLDATAPKPVEDDSTPPAPPPPATAEGREAQQQYLEGVIYFQKGDYVKARVAWTKAKALAAPGSDAAKDAAAGLERLDMLGARVEGDTPAPLRDAKPDAVKDEHAAMQAYLTGMIRYQKGDLAAARTEWTRALALAPKSGSVASDAKAALEKLDKEEGSTRRDGKK